MTSIITKFIADNAVTNAKLAQAPAFTMKGNNDPTTALVADLTVTQVQGLLNVAPLNSWATYTPTITGFGTVSSAKGSYKQVGDTLSLRIYFVAGTVAASLASFSLPGGFTLSSSFAKIPVANTTSQPGFAYGSYTANSNTSNNFGTWQGAIITAIGTATDTIYAGSSITDLTNLLTAANGNDICDTGSSFTLQCELILQ